MAAIQALIRDLIIQHKNVCKEIEYLYERDHQPSNLIKQLVRPIEVLVCLSVEKRSIRIQSRFLDANIGTL